MDNHLTGNVILSVLDLDTTTRRPEESAQLIVDHWIAHR